MCMARSSRISWRERFSWKDNRIMRESNLINGIVAKRNRSSRCGITMIEFWWARPAETNEVAVPTVASVSQSTPHPHRSETSACPLCAPTSNDSALRPARSSSQDIGHLPGTVATPPMALDVPRPRERRTHEQRQRTRSPPSGVWRKLSLGTQSA